MLYLKRNLICPFAVLILLQLFSVNLVAQNKGRKNVKPEISACEGKLDILYAMVRSKCEYEKSRYRNESGTIQRQKKQAFWDSLIIVNNNARSLEFCITLLLQDSTYGRDKVIEFKYLDPLSSFVGPCVDPYRRDFLEWTLFNFNVVKSDTSFICPREYYE